MEGQVTKLGERISWTTDHDIVRGEVIEDATAESDVAEEVWQAEYLAAFGVIYLRRLCHASGFLAFQLSRQLAYSGLYQHVLNQPAGSKYRQDTLPLQSL